jgi:hypothetical protein
MSSPDGHHLSQRWWWQRHLGVNAGVSVALLAVMLWWSIVPELSDEGRRLLARGALLLVMLLVAALARTLVGRNPKRQLRMAVGTIGGMAAGVAASAPLSAAIGTDVSTLSAIAGVFVGWAVAYQFVKRIPRDV